MGGLGGARRARIIETVAEERIVFVKRLNCLVSSDGVGGACMRLVLVLGVFFSSGGISPIISISLLIFGSKVSF